VQKSESKTKLHPHMGRSLQHEVGKGGAMSQTFRQPEILGIARSEGRVSVEDLAVRFGVTVQTIRRDLSELADAGKLERVHGGAVMPSGVSNIAYEERRALNDGAKRAIARACARDVPDGASVFLDIGTTTEAVARALIHHRDLMAVTNNLNVANILQVNTDCEIVLLGGTLRRSDGGVTGAETAAMIARFKPDVAVIGCSALDTDGDLLDFDFHEVHVTQAALAQARRRVLVSDHSKFQRTAPMRVASLCQIDTFYTDKAVPPELAARIAEWDTRVAVCSDRIRD
jgi:DeoR family glycerol-3-phosphate regulon repressor